jgi:predicted MFS family arabinose efflux permease
MSFLNLSIIKKAYGGLETAVWLLALTQFINRMGTMVIFSLAVYLNETLHFSKEDIGIMMGLFGAGSFLGVYIGGRLVDTIGYYRVMWISLILGGLMFISIGFLRSFGELCIGLFLTTLFAEAFRPANMTAVSFYSKPENYTRSISINRLAINLGFSIGPMIGGYLSDRDAQLIFWADGITCIMAAGIVITFLRRIPVREVEKHHRKSEQGRALSPLRDSLFLIFLPLTVLYAVSFLQFFSTMPLYYREVEELSKSQIGLLMGLNGLLVAVIEMVMIYKIEHKTSTYNFIAIGSALLVISYGALLIVHGWWWMAVLTVVISFSEMLAMPFMNTWVNGRSVDSNKGRYMAWYGMAWSAAQILTPIIATQVISSGGYNVLWMILAGFGIIVLFGIKRLEKRVVS